MEKFYLEVPSLSRKEEALEYIKEHEDYQSDMNGDSGLNHCPDDYSYEEWLVEIEKKKNREYAYSIGRVPGEVYYLIRESDDKIIGMINIRYDLTPEMMEFGGHIGYGIRPTERRKGYNKINLYLGLLRAKELGLEHVMLDCTTENIGSNATIKALGGVLTRTAIDPWDEMLTNVYWIDVAKSLKEYQAEFEPYRKQERKKK